MPHPISLYIAEFMLERFFFLSLTQISPRCRTPLFLYMSYVVYITDAPPPFFL